MVWKKKNKNKNNDDDHSRIAMKSREENKKKTKLLCVFRILWWFAGQNHSTYSLDNDHDRLIQTGHQWKCGKREIDWFEWMIERRMCLCMYDCISSFKEAVTRLQLMCMKCSDFSKCIVYLHKSSIQLVSISL